MPIINLNERSGSRTNEDGTPIKRPVLPTDIYRMKIVECSIGDNNFELGKDGKPKKQLVVVWEVSALTDEQAEIADERGEEWLGVRVWQRSGLFYGNVKEGGPSKFKAFIEKVRAAGYLPAFDLDAFDTDELVGVEMKVSVSEYIKTMGENAGKPGNKVLDVTALRQKGTPKMAPRNVPVNIDAASAGVPF